MNRIFIFGSCVATLAAALLLPWPAGACGPWFNVRPFPAEQALTGGEPDVTPPATPLIANAGVEGRDGGGGCLTEARSKCGGAALVVDLEPPAGETEGQIGWIFRVVEGAPPSDDLVPEGPVIPEYGTSFSFGNPGDEAFDFTLEVVAVDTAGNRSGPATVRIRDAGETSGCTSAGAGRSLPWLVLFGVLALRRRAR